MRYARRTDGNQRPIVDALRAVGARVKVVHQPYDLQVWATNDPNETRTMYMEVKNPATAYGRKGMNGKQTEEAQGMPVALVDGVDAALRMLSVLRSKA